MAETALPPAARFDLGDAVMASAIGLVRAARGRPIVASLCGPQGSGKSTSAERLKARLADEGLATAIFSLDDFYLTRAEREALAATVHPLLVTRGVPGTHDVALLDRTISALLAARNGDRTPIPRFDKAADDRADPAGWAVQDGPVDVVLVEGWCLGARPQPEGPLADPVNRLEREEDSAGIWRHSVNDRLASDYAALFARFDIRILLRAPGFENVHRWRAEQEAGLPRAAGNSKPPMDEAALTRFIAHYERLTRWVAEDEPADLVVDIGDDRAPLGWRTKT